MISFKLSKGLVFIDGSKRWELQRKLVNGKVQFEGLDGTLISLDSSEILKKWHSLDWIVDEENLSELKDALFLSTPKDFSSLSKKDQGILKRRKRYVDAIKELGGKYNYEVWKEKIKKTGKESMDPKPPSPTTVFTWVRRYGKGNCIQNLLPQNRNKRKQRNDKRYQFFEDVISNVYLNKQKVSKINVCKNINLAIHRHNEANQDSPPIKMPAMSTVYRWLDELQQNVVEASRLGAEAVRIKHRIAMEGVKTDQIRVRYEIDHTPLDVIIIDLASNLVIGRPWLTLIMDCCSKLIVGYYVSFNNPSAYAVTMAVKQAILPKEELLKSYGLAGTHWPAYGNFELLVADNGMDLHASALRQTCLEMGIEIMYVPAKTPFAKGQIERLIGTLNRELIHQLPGSTFSNIGERGDYKSEENAAIDLETLNKIILKWVTEVYHKRPHKSLNARTPLEVWDEKSQQVPLELPANPQAVEVATGIPATRTCFHYGLELDGLRYNDQRLQTIRHALGKNIKVELKFYEDQVGFIHVLDPKTEQYFKVVCVHAEFFDIHRQAYRLTRQHARKRYGERYTIPQLLESMDEIQTMIKAAVKNKKMANRKKAARLNMQDSDITKNDVEANFKMPDLDAGIDDEIPAIKTTKIDGGENDYA